MFLLLQSAPILLDLLGLRSGKDSETVWCHAGVGSIAVNASSCLLGSACAPDELLGDILWPCSFLKPSWSKQVSIA